MYSVMLSSLQLDTARPRTRGLCAGTSGFVSRKKGARSKGKEEKEGEKRVLIIVGQMIIYVESREVKII